MTQSPPHTLDPARLARAISELKISMARGLGGGLDPRDDSHSLECLDLLEKGYRGKSETALVAFAKAIRFPESLPGVSRSAVLARGQRFLYGLGIEIEDGSQVIPAKTKRKQRVSDPEMYTKDRAMLDLAGIGPKTAARLASRDISTPRDILYLLPRRYDDRRKITKIKDAKPGQRVVTTGVVEGVRLYGRPWKPIMELSLRDGESSIYGVWFSSRRPPPDRFQNNRQVYMAGQVSEYKGRLQIAHPIVTDTNSGDRDGRIGRIVPIYPEVPGVAGRIVEKAILSASRDTEKYIEDPMPPAIIHHRKLKSLPDAIRSVHVPPSDIPAESLDMWVNGSSPAHQRLAYDEFFFLQLALLERRRNATAKNAVPISNTSAIPEEVAAHAGFAPTSAQSRVLREIFDDIGRAHPMQRLLQGDVGSGKTFVALGALVAAARSSGQAALMAPTEILAEQHMQSLHPILEKLGIRSVLHIGGARSSTRKKNLAALERGTAQIAIGTHALLQEKVVFRNLTLAIVDEQHRFGVSQRLGLVGKGPNDTTPHLLVMTATPIPRTLALTIHGDLDISIIDELPPGRTKIETKIWSPKQREKIWPIAAEAMDRREQVYVVCPIIEESEHFQVPAAEEVYEHLLSRFKDKKLGLLHGRLPPGEKDDVMKNFARGHIDLLVATTVVEVGIDVPNATVMIIEGAERFGLAQLHQLRGRVGRSHLPSSCHLIGETNNTDAGARLEAFAKTNDGFGLAEADLAIRGPGEIYGRQQAGLPGFRYGHLVRDAKLLIAAREDALAFIKNKDMHQGREGEKLRQELLRRILSIGGPVGEEAG